jgi:YidC/Oxa1 family membrane protein insertase
VKDVETRRLVTAFALSLLVLLLWQELVVNRYSKPQAPESSPALDRPSTPVPTAPAPAAPATEARAPASQLAAPTVATAEAVVETDVLRAAITPTGARLTKLELTRYHRTNAPDSELLQLVEPGPVLPGTLQLGNGKSDAGVDYRPDRWAIRMTQGDTGKFLFVGQTPEGMRIHKLYRFYGDTYLIRLEVEMFDAKPPDALGLVLTPMPPEKPDKARTEVAVALSERRLKQITLADLQKPEIINPVTWAGFAEQYFLAAVLPGEGTAPAMMGTADGVPIVRLDSPVRDGRAEFLFYAGPKEGQALAGAGHDLDRALDFGWFWFIALPLLQGLRFLHRLTGNYGVAIILLTTLVKVATIPLTHTTYRNMREMQKLQPQMLKIRERFKDDQAAQQKEMMELYRRHRVNPLSGCIPMLLQIPIFIGLYNALMYAIELRHAPFALWIDDLSAPDWLMVGGIGVPVLTLLMGASMFVQQWMTPAQGDPMQQRMMMIMPLIFTFTFINFPSGLVLYWLINNVITIAQQYVMMRRA